MNNINPNESSSSKNLIKIKKESELKSGNPKF